MSINFTPWNARDGRTRARTSQSAKPYSRLLRLAPSAPSINKGLFAQQMSACPSRHQLGFHPTSFPCLSGPRQYESFNTFKLGASCIVVRPGEMADIVLGSEPLISLSATAGQSNRAYAINYICWIGIFTTWRSTAISAAFGVSKSWPSRLLKAWVAAKKRNLRPSRTTMPAYTVTPTGLGRISTM